MQLFPSPKNRIMRGPGVLRSLLTGKITSQSGIFCHLMLLFGTFRPFLAPLSQYVQIFYAAKGLKLLHN